MDVKIQNIRFNYRNGERKFEGVTVRFDLFLDKFNGLDGETDFDKDDYKSAGSDEELEKLIKERFQEGINEDSEEDKSDDDSEDNSDDKEEED